MRRWILVLSGQLVACGPVLGVGDDDGSSTSSSTTSGASSNASEDSASVPVTTGTPGTTATSTTASPPMTTSTAATFGTTAGDESTGTVDCLDGGGFIPPGPCQDRCYRPIPGCNECDVWKQDCPEGEKCSAYADDGGSVWNAMRCVPVSGEPNPVGEACMVEAVEYSGVDTCGAGARCWNVDPETNIGECVALCTGSEASPSCAGSDVCLVANGVINVCVSECDPLLQECAGEQGCYPTVHGFACVPLQAGLLASEDDTCTLINDCAVGTACAEVEACAEPGMPCCVPFCDLAEPGCPAGVTCVDALGDPVVGLCQAG